MTQDEAKPRIIELWRKRAESERKPNDVFIFYGKLSADGSRLLLFKCAGDKYQRIKGWLLPYTVEKKSDGAP
jgi:hypothetical protein